MVQGKSGISSITSFDASQCLTQIGGQLPAGVSELENRFLDKEHLRCAPQAARIAILAAFEALNDAHIPHNDWKERTAVITGCGSALGDPRGKKQFHWFYHEMFSSLPAIVSELIGLGGPACNIATACSSSGFAISSACNYVMAHKEPCLVIGLDTLLHKDTIDGFNAIMALSELNEAPHKASRPFDKERSGFVLSDGACALFLEPKNTAEQRGAMIYSTIIGHAMTSEGYNIVAPEPEGKGMAATISKAIKSANIRVSDIKYISAHGTATIHNDIAETKAIKKVFGDYAYTIPISSQKSMIGHTIGAAAAIECGITALILKNSIITPTINLDYFDPQCDLDYVPHRPRKAENLRTAISNSFGFGGHNSTIVLHK